MQHGRCSLVCKDAHLQRLIALAICLRKHGSQLVGALPVSVCGALCCVCALRSCQRCCRRGAAPPELLSSVLALASALSELLHQVGALLSDEPVLVREPVHP